MADKVIPGPFCGTPSTNFKEAVCINTNKIYDSCKDKDCIEDMRVYLTRSSQAVVDRAINVRSRSAEILWVYIDVEPVPFNSGFFSVDVKFFFKVSLEAFVGLGKPTIIYGLSTFDKQSILFGSEGTARMFSSKFVPGELDDQTISRTNAPIATVEVVDPIALGVKVVDPDERCCCCGECDVTSLPRTIIQCFDEELVDSSDHKRVFITLGLFSIVRIERPVQLLIPAYDFCIPQKECDGGDNNPCALFDKIKFPVDQFFPPRAFDKDCGCQAPR